MAAEFVRISSAVGKEGKINQRASLGSASGDWSECLESVNGLIGDLVQPSTEVARVIGAHCDFHELILLKPWGNVSTK